jgi:chromosome segregation ATPase
MAMEVAQKLEVERGVMQKNELQRQAEALAAVVASEKLALRNQLVAAEERCAELEGEVRTLKEAMQEAHTSAESLAELSRAQVRTIVDNIGDSSDS